MTSPARASTGVTVGAMPSGVYIDDTIVYDKVDGSTALSSHFTGNPQASPSSSPQAVGWTI